MRTKKRYKVCHDIFSQQGIYKIINTHLTDTQKQLGVTGTSIAHFYDKDIALKVCDSLNIMEKI